MKLLSAFSALTVANAQSLFQLLQSQIDQRYDYESGAMRIDFAPYAVLTTNDDGISGELSLDLQDSGNNDVVSYTVLGGNGDTYPSGLKIEWQGHGSNLPIPAGGLINTYDGSMTTKYSIGLTGAKLSYEFMTDFDYHSGNNGNIDEKFTLESFLTKSGKKFELELESEGQRTVNNVELEMNLPIFSMIFIDPYTLKSQVKLTVANVELCQLYSANLKGTCDVSLKHNSSVNKSVSSHAAQLKFREFAVILKLPKVIVFIRGEDARANTTPLRGNPNGKSYYGLYYAGVPKTGRANWQKLMKQKKDTLVVRLPGQDVVWAMFEELMNMSQPFMQLLASMSSNMNANTTAPYVIYWLDELLATMDNEFDCSKLVELSRVESEVLADCMEVQSINKHMSNVCTNFNDGIMENLKSAELKRVFVEMRKYMENMACGNAGHNEFLETYGKIF